MEAVLCGKVATNYTPGNSVAEDKEFYPYVEKIIKFYLREEPILKNIKTIDARVPLGDGGYGGMNEPLMDDLERNRQKYVIKMVDGWGGEQSAAGESRALQDSTVHGTFRLRRENHRLAGSFGHRTRRKSLCQRHRVGAGDIS